MNSIKKGIKMELMGWKPLEVLWLLFASAVILGLSIYWKDNMIGIISALTGIWCVIFTGKGKRSSFIFGMVNVLCYAYISFNAKYYGEVMLNVLYYVPMNVVGWILWTRHMSDESGEVSKEKMSVKSSIFVYGLTFIGIIGYGYILKAMGGNLPFFDSMSTVVAITAQILSVKRLKEQWILWIVVDIITVIMWAVHFAQGGESIATLAMWSIYLVNAIIMYVKWNKETR